MKKILYVPALIFSFLLFMLSFSMAEEVRFPADKQFDVYYEVSETLEVDKVSRVYVKGVVTIGNVEFLNIINGSNLTNGEDGYVCLANIRAIVPVSLPVKRKIGAASVEDSTS